MKERLQKDLKFLKPWWARLIFSAIIGILFALIASGMTTNYNRRDDNAEIGWLVGAVVAFIGLYFFYAWLYPSTDKTE